MHICDQGFLNVTSLAILSINLLYKGNPLTGTFTNSVDPDEMLHDAAFYQGIHCLLR